MTNKFMNGLKKQANYGETLNGATALISTRDNLYDLFALGGAYRNKSTSDRINLFKDAYEQDPINALRCLFYLRDVRGGQGERLFFRECYNWLAKEHTGIAEINLHLIPEYGRWDDLYCLFDTPLEKNVLECIKLQLEEDLSAEYPSLLAKWLKSENTSSAESRKMAKKIRYHLGMSSKEYRLTLSKLRERIKVLERLMSRQRWDEIEFDKIPSKAGLKYSKAFARHDIIADKYKEFISNKDTKVNADALYPYEIVHKACNVYRSGVSKIEREAINKYWENLKDYIHNTPFNGMAVVDTSASMWGRPIEVAISLGMYCAEKISGPFAGHYISFSRNARLIEFKGYDFCDKVEKIMRANLCENTNLASVFDLVLNTGIKNHCSQEEMPENLIVISDMGIDRMCDDSDELKLEISKYREKFEKAGYKFPRIYYWNVNAIGQANILDDPDNNGVSYISGFSPTVFQQIMECKTGKELMFDILLNDRYSPINWIDWVN